MSFTGPSPPCVDDGIRPEDSASQSGSTSSSVRLKAIARKAALAAEAAALKQRLALEREELDLRQRKIQLDMDTRIKIAEAEAEVYLSAEEGHLATDVKDLHGAQAKVDDVLPHLVATENSKVREDVRAPLGAHAKPDDFLPRPDDGNNSKMREEVTRSYERPRAVDTQDLLLQIIDNSQKQQRDLLEGLFVPQTQIMTFDGSPLKFWEFWRAFESTVDCTGIPDSAKLTRLLHYCEGDARKILQSCSIMPPSEGYRRAKALLHGRFGTPFMIADAWIRKVTGGPKIPGRDKRMLQELADELQARADEENDPVFGKLLVKEQSARTSPPINKASRSRRSTFSTSASGEETAPLVCVKCKESHTLFACNAFKQMQPEERFKLVVENKLCFNCLEKGHTSRNCQVKRVCSVPGCKRKHTKFLHRDKMEQPRQAQEGVGEPATEKVESYATGAGGNKRILLPIVPIRVYASAKDDGVEALALLDSGSTSTFCTEELAERVKAHGSASTVSVSTLDRANSELHTTVVSLRIEPRSSPRVVTLPRVYTKADINISVDHLLCRLDVDQFAHLSDIHFPSSNKVKVDILIGQDYPELLCPLETRRGEPGEPYAVRTVLGWTLNGPVQGNGKRMPLSSHFISEEMSLDNQCKMFWSLETSDMCNINTAAKGMSVQDQEVLKLWEDNVVRSGGHYQLPIPFKEQPPPLSENRWMAQQRLESLKRRLSKDELMHAKYSQGMADLLDKGYAEAVDDSLPLDGTCWYLPHHPVVNEKKPEKVRIVFDCAAKSDGVGLNDVVRQGPDLTNKLSGVLLRFRQAPVAIMADVEAMFHQVKLDADERDVLRFLWWPGGKLDEVPRTYRMCVHLFGGTWSPSCCSFALRQTAKDFGDQCNTEAPKVVERNFYVDDCLVSVENEDDAIKLSTELRELLQKGGFRLAKWLSNSPRVLQSIPVSERAKKVAGIDLNFEALPVERALGMIWDIEMDSFIYKIQPKPKPLSRRGILSIVSSIYDPLGYASPFVLRGKMILQELTRKKLSWDEPIPDIDAKNWRAWIEELPEMEGFGVHRCVKPQKFGKVTEYTIHNFSDASEVAYGAVSYLVISNEEGQVHSSLLMAKSRLAPIKTVTIPRLELMAATLAVNMDIMVREELDLPIKMSYFWTDSMIVLHYIRSEDRRFKVFVSNRLATIHQVTELSQWRHIDTKVNPADVVSRGTSPMKLKNDKGWLEGPDFIQLPEEQWPKCPFEKEEINEDDPELKPTKVQTFAVSDGRGCIDRILMHYSDWTRLRRAVAWWLKLKEYLRGKSRNSVPGKCSSLKPEDLKCAEKAIFQHVQHESFPEELKLLKEIDGIPEGRERVVKKGSKLAKMDPVFQDGLLRVGGRLRRAQIPGSAKHQVIMPRRHHVSTLLVRYVHKNIGHQGQNHVLAELRQQYWILGAGVLVRGLVRKCVTCRRYQAKVGKQKMADLPAYRVAAGEPAFTNVGMDFFGPFEIKCGRSVRKRYGVVFTCMATRAIHIEVADSLETSSCIDAIRRMMSRRGPITKLVSDNGTNLVGAEGELRKALKDWNQEEMSHFTSNKGIDWSFNPPGASHYGGVWERQIRTIRKVLQAVLNEQYLRTCQTEEQLHTLMCEVEAIVNSRPLTRVSDDPGDLEVITPSSLLNMKRTSTLPPCKSTMGDIYARRRWKQMQHLADDFWRRWIREYLPSLQQRQRWEQPERNLDVGDVVLIADGTLPRGCWLMGRVCEIHPDKHGRVRSAKVKTATSMLTRPITKLCLLLEQEESR
ncbi:uncharacterized protein LOC121419759 [Lytechinus variegatus]|uniref:uncharacterized protein LOC121419759 n=1 Tax=Lytechinus variegatus TaxID=7654 RepID=UPI001BB18A46|nr:uncharacterized protein LOC121419759 [Lytechinus variegatus]